MVKFWDRNEFLAIYWPNYLKIWLQTLQPSKYILHFPLQETPPYAEYKMRFWSENCL